MRKSFAVLTIVFAASTAAASDLLLKADYHHVNRADMTAMAAVFADEHLVTTIRLDVYAVPQLPSTRRSLDDLRKLDASNWLRAIRWSLRDEQGRELAVPRANLLAASMRQRGPKAPRAADRDVTADCTTFEARLDFGPLPAGDYTLEASIHQLKSAFPLSIRTGQESDVRETFLEVKAGRASSYSEYRELQLERYRINPSRLDPVFEVIDRALRESTLEETRALFAMALEKMEQRRVAATEPAKVQFFERRVRELRATEHELPEYFNHRTEWAMERTSAGNYVIRDRKTGTIVSDFARDHE
jgi:hypothetical protein